jgi:hypothetical protein
VVVVRQLDAVVVQALDAVLVQAIDAGRSQLGRPGT